MRGETAAPAGYTLLRGPHYSAVARVAQADPIRSALVGGTLYSWAEAQPERREYRGRAPAYGAVLADGTRVVVRHSWHGGMLAPLTRDLFLPPTRAPRELETALRLRTAGVPTPEVVAYVVYAAGPLLRRADVATAEVPDARDLGEVLLTTRSGDAEREEMLAPVAELLRRLIAARARHPDLNVKNVLVAREAGELRAFVIDVDRVAFDGVGSDTAGPANARRLFRSIEKWTRRHGIELGERDTRLLLAGRATAESHR